MSDPVDLNAMIENVTSDLDPPLARAFRTAMEGTYRLGAAVMRRQLMERIADEHQSTEIKLLDIALEGLAPH